MPGSWLSASSRGCSTWHSTHHEANTLTMVGSPWARSAAAKPGTAVPSAIRPSIAGRLKSGTGLPISAEGRREGSPPCSAYQNRPASTAKISKGSAGPSRRKDGARVASVMVGVSAACRPCSPGLCWRAGRAPPDPFSLKLGDEAPLLAVVLDDEQSERRHRDEGHAVGGEDERCVRAEIEHRSGLDQSFMLDLGLLHGVHATAVNLGAHGDEMQQHEEQREGDGHDQERPQQFVGLCIA